MRRLHRIVRDGATLDGAGGSTIVERFDLLTQALYTWQRGDRPISCGAELRADFERLARQRPSLFPGRYAAIRTDDGTLDLLAAALADATLPAGGDLAGIAYEEVIRDTFDKGDHQQFFTPRTVVRFMVELVADRLTGRVCDPACGTGGFLLGALERARADGHAGDLKLLGLEIDERLAWTAAVNLDLHGAVTPDVRHLGGAGSLGPLPADLAGRIDVVLTNPPFGSDLNDPGALAALELGRGRASRRRGVLFVERCLELVRPGGTVAIVIDDAALNGKANADLRQLIGRRAEVEAVVSLPEVTFMPYATVRSSIVVLRRRAPDVDPVVEDRPPTFFARAEEVGRRTSGDPLLRPDPATGRLVDDDDLPAIARAFEALRAGRPPVLEGPRPAVFAAVLPDADDAGFVVAGSRLDVAYHDPARLGAVEGLRRTPWAVYRLDELCALRHEPVVPARECPDDELAYLGLADIEAGTGRCTPRPVIGEQVRSGSLRVHPGDVLFARMRPELRKACCVPAAPQPLVASAECLVLVPHRAADGRVADSRAAAPRPSMDPHLLSLLLRSDLTHGQLVHLVTGIGRPRIARAAVMALRLPVPPPEVQRRLLHDLDAATAHAATQRREARALDGAAAATDRQALDALLQQLLTDRCTIRS